MTNDFELKYISLMNSRFESFNLSRETNALLIKRPLILINLPIDLL